MSLPRTSGAVCPHCGSRCVAALRAFDARSALWHCVHCRKQFRAPADDVVPLAHLGRFRARPSAAGRRLH
jgi:DNA-directed RNA polymerase subunit RPC12/RpoP